MQLSTYLRENEISVHDMAGRLNVSDEAVRLWAKGQRIPRRETMLAIERETGGAVMPSDFFSSADAAA